MEKVMNIVKRFRLGFYVGIVSIILSIVGLAMYGSDFSLPYYSSSVNSGLIVLGAVSIVLLLVYCIFPFFKFGSTKIGKLIMMICVVVSAIILTYVTFEFIRVRVYDFAVVLGSDLELGNDSAFEAVYHSITTIVILIISLVGLIFTSFLTPIKEKEEEIVAA